MPSNPKGNEMKYNAVLDLDLIRLHVIYRYEVLELDVTEKDKGEADIGVGAISVTAERESIIDFSHPFYDSGLQIMVRASQDGDSSSVLIDILKKVFTLNFVLILLTIIAAIYLISHLIWFFERRVNHEQWPAEYKKGIGESIWFTITTMLVGGTDNKGPIGFGGRFVTMLWMLFSSILISFFTATFTTTMTINKLNSNEINGPEDLPGVKVATIKGSYSENLLNEKDADIKSYDNIKDCIKALREKQVKAIVYDAPVLQYELKSLADDQFQLVGPVFSKQYYDFPIKKDRALLEEINKALLSSSESGVLSELKEKYFNTDN